MCYIRIFSPPGEDGGLGRALAPSVPYIVVDGVLPSRTTCPRPCLPVSRAPSQALRDGRVLERTSPTGKTGTHNISAHVVRDMSSNVVCTPRWFRGRRAEALDTWCGFHSNDGDRSTCGRITARQYRPGRYACTVRRLCYAHGLTPLAPHGFREIRCSTQEWRDHERCEQHAHARPNQTHPSA